MTRKESHQPFPALPLSQHTCGKATKHVDHLGKQTEIHGFSRIVQISMGVYPMVYTYLCPQGLHLPSLCLLLRVPRGSRAAVGLSRTDLCLQWVHDWEWTAFYYFTSINWFWRMYWIETLQLKAYSIWSQLLYPWNSKTNSMRLDLEENCGTKQW
jgi:hypothetical protein